MSKTDTFVDSQWLGGVVSQYEGPLTLYAWRIVGNTELARDVVQETFLRLCSQSVESRRRIEDHLPQWLYTVCRNAALNVRRKEGRMVTSSEIHEHKSRTDTADPASLLQAKESQSLALGALSDLPENQREVIRLKFQHGMSYRQISAVTGRTTSYVGYLIHAGLKSIRHKLESGRLKDTGS
jgi:RNA polymerase sigma factor (sigma-70 family)